MLGYAVGVPQTQIVSVNAKADRYLKRTESRNAPSRITGSRS